MKASRFLLVEQNVRAAVEIADRAYVLDDGRIVYEGDARAFGADEQRVRELAGASAEKWDVDGRRKSLTHPGAGDADERAHACRMVGT